VGLVRSIVCRLIHGSPDLEIQKQKISIKKTYDWPEMCFVIGVFTAELHGGVCRILTGQRFTQSILWDKKIGVWE